MATLVSPGVAVSVVDESMYVSSGPGTVPLVFIATEQDKINSAGDGIASGTTKANAGKLWLITSQRDLLQTFGTPIFRNVAGNQIHGDPTNEYGLLASHSYLGLANRAFVVRADIDTAQLQPLDNAPVGLPVDGTYWLDVGATPTISQTSLKVWQDVEQDWTDVDSFIIEDSTNIDTSGAFPVPKNIPKAYDYALITGRMVDESTGSFILENLAYAKYNDVWYPLNSEELTSNGIGTDIQYGTVYPVTRRAEYDQQVPPVLIPGTGGPLVGGDLWINNNKLVANVKKYNATTGAWEQQSVPVFDTTDEAEEFYGDDLVPGKLFLDYNFRDFGQSQATVFQHALKIYSGNDASAPATITALPDAGDLGPAFSISIDSREYGTHDFTQPGGPLEPLNGRTVIEWMAEELNQAFQGTTGTGAGIPATNPPWSNFEAIAKGDVLTITDTTNTAFRITAATGAADPFEVKTYAAWEGLTYESSSAIPSGDLEAGTLWYSTEFKVDIMENDGLGAWVELSAPMLVQPSEPTDPAEGTIWVDSDQLSEYPVMYRFKNGKWVMIDNTDQTTPNGVLFADARPMSSGALDADAPDPLASPKGMLLWNSRYSTRNVKEWTPDYTFEGNLVGDRWVSASGNDFDGSLITGDAAVKKIITEAMAAAINDNEDIRSEFIFYNLMAAPGFVECVDEMIALNVDRKETAFIVGDTPFHLQANGTDLQEWASNSNIAPSNGDAGLTSYDEYLGVYYPSGLTSNLDGAEVVVPPSHMVLRTMAYNDQVAYPWFAPAGLQRGVISNATSVGYLDDENEYVPVSLNSGLRDVLYTNSINPLYTVPNRGLTVYGQKTRSSVASALDRINVARLINYLRYQSDIAAAPFLFEPNDTQTQNSIKASFDGMLAQLVALRGVYDFLVVCDASNNTPDRVDRNELWVDIAIQPVKAVEFIYVPIRIKNTGESLNS